MPTLTGVLLIAVALGIGAAAYNTGSNILFITLSLLLSCLILSGVLSWLNLRGLGWRLHAATPWRVGQDQVVVMDMRNRKQVLPTYGVWFSLRAVQAEARTRLMLRERLDAGETTRLEWVVRPTRRGRERIEMTEVGSLFPFGFLRKCIGGNHEREVTVWPAPVTYRRHGGGGAWRQHTGERDRRIGQGGDLLALRRYATGDSHRQIHWKATARLRKLMVRQVSAENEEGYTVWLETPAELWPRPEQFELLVSFVATLTEDLFRAGQLLAVALNANASIPVRRLRDVELFLDRLSLVEPVASSIPTSPTAVRRRNLLTFAPEGLRGVCAYLDGAKTASA